MRTVDVNLFRSIGLQTLLTLVSHGSAHLVMHQSLKSLVLAWETFCRGHESLEAPVKKIAELLPPEIWELICLETRAYNFSALTAMRLRKIMFASSTPLLRSRDTAFTAEFPRECVDFSTVDSVSKGNHKFMFSNLKTEQGQAIIHADWKCLPVVSHRSTAASPLPITWENRSAYDLIEWVRVYH